MCGIQAWQIDPYFSQQAFASIHANVFCLKWSRLEFYWVCARFYEWIFLEMQYKILTGLKLYGRGTVSYRDSFSNSKFLKVKCALNKND